MLSPEAETQLEERIDAIEAETGVEIVVYTQHDSDISEDENLDNAGGADRRSGASGDPGSTTALRSSSRSIRNLGRAASACSAAPGSSAPTPTRTR